MLIDDVKEYVDTMFMGIARKVIRRNGVCPLALVKVYADEKSPIGFRTTEVGRVEEGSGLYDTEDFGRLKDDIVAAGKEEGVIAVVYALPFEDLESEGVKYGDVLMVGVNAKELGEKFSDKKIVFYKTKPIEDDKDYIESIMEGYRKDYLIAMDVDKDDFVGCTQAEKEFDENIGPVLEPMYYDVVAGGAWGDLLMSQHVCPSPF
jgi:hypothetical protein